MLAGLGQCVSLQPAPGIALDSQDQTGQDKTDLGEGAQGLQAPSHGGSKAALPAQGGEEQAVLRPMHLVGPVRAPELLQALVSAPGQLQGKVHPAPLVGCPPVRSRQLWLSTRCRAWVQKAACMRVPA